MQKYNVKFIFSYFLSGDRSVGFDEITFLLHYYMLRDKKDYPVITILDSIKMQRIQIVVILKYPSRIFLLKYSGFGLKFFKIIGIKTKFYLFNMMSFQIAQFLLVHYIEIFSRREIKGRTKQITN